MKKFLFSILATAFTFSGLCAVHVAVVQDVPKRLYISSDTQNTDSYILEQAQTGSDDFIDYQRWWHYDHKWQESGPGTGGSQGQSQWNTWDIDGNNVFNLTGSSSTTISWDSDGNGTVTQTSNGESIATNSIGAPSFANGYCLASVPWNTDQPTCSEYHDGNGSFKSHTQKQEYFRYAQTRWTLQTGGSAFSKPHKRLWQLSASAVQQIIKRPPLWSCSEVVSRPVVPEQIKIRGKELYPDGSYWVELDDFQELDVTPVVDGANNYIFGVAAEKHTLNVAANEISINDRSLLQPQFLFCTGQKVSLSAYFVPALQGVDTIQYEWTASGDSVNQAVGPNSAGCVTYTEDPAKWKLENPYAWWLTGGNKDIQVKLTLIFTNSQHLTVSDSGKFGMAEPQVIDTTFTCSGVNIFTDGSSLEEIALKGTDGAGMEFANHVQRPDQFPGIAWHAQLINRCIGYDTPVSSETNNTSGFWLDTVNPYKPETLLPLYSSTGNPTTPVRDVVLPDAPGLVSGLFGFSSFAEVKDDFQTFLLWKPTGSGSIPVPLGRNDWGWHGRAEKSGGAWSLTISNWYGPTFTVGRNYPYWTNVYHNN